MFKMSTLRKQYDTKWKIEVNTSKGLSMKRYIHNSCTLKILNIEKYYKLSTCIIKLNWSAKCESKFFKVSHNN